VSAINPFSQYIENQLTTASPAKLLLMAFDGAIRFGRIARQKMEARKLDEQSENIRKTQSILVELMNALNHEANPELARRLDALYTYMFDRLTHANIHDDLKALDEVLDILSQLRDTWAQANLAAYRETTGRS